MIKLGYDVYGYKISVMFDFGQNPTSISRIICPWITKIAIFHLVTTLTLSFLLQSKGFLHRMCLTLRSLSSSILGKIRPVLIELSALELQNIAIFYLVTMYHSSDFISSPIKLIFALNMFDPKILVKFDIWQNPTIIFLIICPWIAKNAIFHLVISLEVSFFFSINLIFTQNVFYLKILVMFDFWQNPTSVSRIICPWFPKIAIFHLVTTLLRSFLLQSWWFFHRMIDS